MGREFYTELDIEDLAKRGVTSLQLSDQVTLTELAYEKAGKLGIKLIQNQEKNPSAPVRPYLSQPSGQCACDCSTCPKQDTCQKKRTLPSIQMSSVDLGQRIRSAVLARLGSQVDAVLLDRIIEKVLNNTGVK